MARTHRYAHDELVLLTGRECEWCGGTQFYSPYAKPHFNPERSFPDRTKRGAVVWGRWVCTNYGACENAPG
jgi:hypothetical protein